jgi:hypothetical protein
MTKAIILYLIPIFTKAKNNLWALIKIMLPLLIILKIIQEFGVMDYLAYPFTPIMNFLDIPSVYALAWLAAIVNVAYSALVLIIVFAKTYSLTYLQLTVLSVSILIAHSLFTESAIAKNLKVNPYFIAIIRLVSAIIVGFLVNLVCNYFGLLQDTVNNPILLQDIDIKPILIDYLSNNSFTSNYKDWLKDIAVWFYNQGKLFIVIFFVLCLLFLLIQLLKDLKLTYYINKATNPIANFIGVDSNNTLVMLLAYIIGLSYGFGLLKEEAKNNPFFNNDQPFKVVLFLAIAHAIIEDSILFMILGANGFVLIFVRTLWGLLMVWLFSAIILPKLSTQAKNRYLYKN